jgi:Raf kinase inhibitor-like YbhB/YbcL family protein
MSRFCCVALIVFAAACRPHEPSESAAVATPQAPPGGMKIASSAFAEGAAIPAQYTCDGANGNPPLEFHAAPQTAQSLALEMVDPDAPSGAFTHWLLWNLPSNTATIADSAQPAPGVAGTNGFGQASYGGPCPPSGPPHHYVFTLYALDSTLSLPAQSKREDVESAIKGHVVAEARLSGTYQRK